MWLARRPLSSGPPPPVRGEGGQILVLTALMLTVLLGITGLAIDAGYSYDVREQLGAAADAGAKAGAFELARNSAITQPQLLAFAGSASALNGFTNGVNGVSVTLNKPPTSGTYSGNAQYVEVIISQPVSTFFAKVLGRTSFTVGARAVAGGSATSPCMVLLSPSATSAFSAIGATVNLPTCGVAIDSSSSTAMVLNNGGALTATSVKVVGNCTGSCGSVTVSAAPNTVTTGAPSQADPLANLVAPTPGTCTGQSNFYGNGNTYSPINPGTFCSGLQISGVTLTLNPGTYIITGGAFTVANAAHLNGTGVTIYLGTGASASLAGGAIVNLSAPTTGTYAGILFYQDRSVTSGFSVTNGSGSTMTGGIYMPGAAVTFNGAAYSNLYSFLIAKTAAFSNGVAVTLNNNTASLPGGSPLVGVVSMAE